MGSHFMYHALTVVVMAAGVYSLGAQTGDSAEQILKHAITLHQKGDTDAAIEAYRSYLKVRPESPLALSNLGAAYAHEGRYEDAIGQYRHALSVQPGNVPVELNLALAYYKTGNTEKAAPIFEAVHRSIPGELQPALLLADCWLAMGRHKEIVDLLTPFSGRNPPDQAVEYTLGTALVRDNQVERGQVLIDKILRNGDSAEAHLLMGTAKLDLSDFAGALEELTKAVRLNPKLQDVYSFYGIALLRTGDQAGAADAFHKELAMNSNDFNANLQLAVLAKMDEDYEHALKYLAQALLVRPNDIGVRYQLASIALAQGNVEGARASLEVIVKEAPTFTEAHVTLATVYYRLKRKDDADRERAVLQKLNAAVQDQQPGVKPK